jgi:spermidine synthase
LFLTGFVAFGYEVTWTRILTNFGTATSYAFTLILASLLAGIMVGSMAVAHWSSRVRVASAGFSAACLVLACLGSAMTWVLSHLETVAARFPLLGRGDAATVLFILPVSVVFGVLFPLGVRAYARSDEHVGEWTGRAYWVNALGSVAGTVLPGFVLIPLLGVRACSGILVCCSLAAGGLAAVQWLSRCSGRGWVVAVGLWGLAAALSLTGLARSGDQFFRRLPGAEVLYHQEGVSSTVTVLGLPAQDGTVLKTLYVDSQAVAGTFGWMVADSKLLAHVPLLLAANPAQAGAVGFGTGGTSYSMRLHGVDVTTLEIERKVVEAAPLFRSLNRGVTSDPRFTLVLDDARHYLARTARRFDVLVTDVTNVKFKRNAYLYTTDYFRLLRDRLTPGGVAAAWVGLGGTSFEDIRIILASFQHVFPHTTVWYWRGFDTDFVILVGTPDRLFVDLAQLTDRLEPVKEDLRTIEVQDVYDVASMLYLGEEDAARLVRGAPLNTDDRPVLEFSDLRAYFRVPPWENEKAMAGFRTEDTSRYFSGTEDQLNRLRDRVRSLREASN